MKIILCLLNLHLHQDGFETVKNLCKFKVKWMFSSSWCQKTVQTKIVCIASRYIRFIHLEQCRFKINVIHFVYVIGSGLLSPFQCLEMVGQNVLACHQKSCLWILIEFQQIFFGPFSIDDESLFGSGQRIVHPYSRNRINNGVVTLVQMFLLTKITMNVWTNVSTQFLICS